MDYFPDLMDPMEDRDAFDLANEAWMYDEMTKDDEFDQDAEFFFLGKTDEELSLVCRTEDTPAHTTERDDGWNGFRIEGVLEFSMIGILSKLSGILAEHRIGLFAVSTYNTDYILVKKENFEAALEALAAEGYTIVE